MVTLTLTLGLLLVSPRLYCLSQERWGRRGTAVNTESSTSHPPHSGCLVSLAPVHSLHTGWFQFHRLWLPVPAMPWDGMEAPHWLPQLRPGQLLLFSSLCYFHLGMPEKRRGISIITKQWLEDMSVLKKTTVIKQKHSKRKTWKEASQLNRGLMKLISFLKWLSISSYLYFKSMSWEKTDVSQSTLLFLKRVRVNHEKQPGLFLQFLKNLQSQGFFHILW